MFSCIYELNNIHDGMTSRGNGEVEESGFPIGSEKIRDFHRIIKLVTRTLDIRLCRKIEKIDFGLYHIIKSTMHQMYLWGQYKGQRGS